VQVKFTNVEEFLRELKIAPPSSPPILRLTTRRRWQGDTQEWSVVATFRTADQTIVRLDRILGSCFPADADTNVQCGHQAEELIEQLKHEAVELQLEVRAGLYEG